MQRSLMRVYVLSILPMLAGCATTTGSELGLTDDGMLPACPVTPNCVSSDAADGRHAIEPLVLGTNPKAAWKALRAYLENDSSYVIKAENADYLRAEARTRLLGFVDDVEFHLRRDQGRIAVRSASRVGISDLGKNRQRLEVLRQALKAAGVLKNGR